ncbi:MAG TPA: prolyl oligopeptidase family serine peptidase, partial [Prosthecobacter sp.]|nr:prolyl oligopeptidase family serine peptidase [Prosthecobacter sp.]
VDGKLPTILYVCGHARVEKNGVAYGNKTAYHHHGIWFARHGYVCMIIDTVELGELRGEHHGTYSKGRWWWLSRGYTPAGLEAWASVRGLDYLETRPEVDKERFGITGRSGGGSYSWWTAAIDERIKAAAPTAGITSMRNHVVDGVVEGHCDCMYHVNTQRWDYDRVAAMIAPRALLVCNTDKDSIFPIDGVFQVYQNARKIYSLLGVEKNIGLQVAEGPHKDLQPLNIGAFHWFERFLKGADPMQVIDEGARKSLEPEVLKVFKDLPKDELNTKIDETFVPKAKTPAVAASKDEWVKQRDAWMTALREQVFAGWPRDAAAVVPTKENSSERDGIRITAYDFESQPSVRLRLYVAHRAGLRAEDLELIALNVLDADGWQDFCNTYETRFSKLIETFPSTTHDEKAFESEKKMFESFKWGMAYLCPRGIGPTEWSGSAKAQTQRLRRFNLIGQTVDGMRVWDIRRGVQALKNVPGFEKTPLWIQGQRDMAVNNLYASLFEDGITRIDLHDMPASHDTGPAYLNVLKHLDIPQATAMALERTRVIIYDADDARWNYAAGTGKLLKLPEKQWQVRKPMTEAQGQ